MILKFKLFNILINGAVEDCCEALINGVPFSNANKASQINGGLDIINALCRHYGVQAPIFIDNRESINQIPDCDSEIINLVVTNDKKLIVEDQIDKFEIKQEEAAGDHMPVNTEQLEVNVRNTVNADVNAEQSYEGSWSFDGP